MFEMGQDRLRQFVGRSIELLNELKVKFDELEKRQIFHGYWDCITDVKGCIPESRKGSSMNLVSNEVYVFGGFSRDTYNDMKVFDL